jgi:hypothetical protein
VALLNDAVKAHPSLMFVMVRSLLSSVRAAIRRPIPGWYDDKTDLEAPIVALVPAAVPSHALPMARRVLALVARLSLALLALRGLALGVVPILAARRRALPHDGLGAWVRLLDPLPQRCPAGVVVE